jgi:hypothetical protein
MAKRADPPADESPERCLQELDSAVAEVLRNLSLADPIDHTSQDPAKPEVSSMVSRTERALRRIMVTLHGMAGGTDRTGSSRVAQPDLLARARTSLETFAGEAKAERQRAAYQTANALEWERNAKLAVHAQNDELATEALDRRAECARLAAGHARRADLLDAEYRILMSALEGDPTRA